MKLNVSTIYDVVFDVGLALGPAFRRIQKMIEKTQQLEDEF